MRQVTKKGLITVVAAGGVLAVGSGTAFADSNAQGEGAGSPGVLSGNTFQAPVNITVNICGNTVSAIGLLNPAAGNACQNSGSGGSSPQGGGPSVQGGHGAQANGSSSDSPGVGSGNNVKVPVDVPVNACGNSLDAVGIGNSATGNGCENPSDDGPDTPDQPGEPDEPTEPGNPPEPQEPGNPDEPSEPGNPGEPGEPSEPGNPGNPGEPGEPGNPGGPDTPAQPGSSGEVRGGSEPQAVQADAAPAAPKQEAREVRGELAETGGGSQLGVLAPAGASMLLGGYVLYRRSRGAARR